MGMTLTKVEMYVGSQAGPSRNLNYVSTVVLSSKSQIFVPSLFMTKRWPERVYKSGCMPKTSRILFSIICRENIEISARKSSPRCTSETNGRKVVLPLFLPSLSFLLQSTVILEWIVWFTKQCDLSGRLTFSTGQILKWKSVKINICSGDFI